MYLAPHIKTLYSQIRNRALIQVRPGFRPSAAERGSYRHSHRGMAAWVSACVCVQYFSPYVSADMTKMAQAFNTTVAALEDELTQLILEGLVNARIDSHSKVKLIPAHTGFDRTLPDTHCDTLTDPLREGRGPEEHHLWEIPPHGQRVSETSQGHDPSSCCAAEPNPCKGRCRQKPVIRDGIDKTLSILLLSILPNDLVLLLLFCLRTKRKRINNKLWT